MIKKRRKTDPNFIMRGLLEVREERASAKKIYKENDIFELKINKK